MSIRLAARAAGLKRTLIREIFESAPADAINLGLGQPDLPTPPSVALAGIAGIARGQTGYGPTAGDPALREAVAATQPELAQGADQVLITVGSQEAMFVACLALLDPGDELLYPDPGYPAYPTVAALAGGRGVAYPLRAENAFRIDAGDIESRLTERTRAVIVNEPSNPTGAISDPAELRRLALVLRSRGVAWISDEIYAGFVYERPLATLAAQDPAGGIVVSGLSKDTSMTGWRIGWIVGPREFVQRCTAVHQHLVTCASNVSQAAAVAAFRPEGRREREAYRETFARRRLLMARELSGIDGLRFAPPDGGFYFFVDAARFGDATECCRRILERGRVIVIPGVAFGRNAPDFIRISFAADELTIREGVRRIGEQLTAGV